MKQKINHYLKFVLVFTGISLVIMSCHKEPLKHLESQSSNNDFLKIKHVSAIHIKENTGLLKKLSSFTNSKSKLNSLNKEVYITEGDFTVETDYAKYMESPDGGFRSYTFAILPHSKEQTTLQNLVLYSYNNSDYYSVLATYQLDHYQLEELKEKDHINSSYPIEFATLDGNYSNLLAREEPCDFEATMYHITPDTGQWFVWEENSVCQHINSTTGETNCQVQVVITLNCISPGGSGGGGSIPDYGTYDWTWAYETGGSTGGNYGGSNNYYIPVASSPTINKKDKLRKEKLMEMIENDVIAEKIAELLPKMYSTSPSHFKEDGARFKLIGENQYEVREPNQRLNSGLNYTPDYFENESVSVHVHQQLFYEPSLSPDPFENTPIESNIDILEFLENVQFINNSDPDLALDVTAFLICEMNEPENPNNLPDDDPSVLNTAEAGLLALVVEDKDKALAAITTLQNDEAIKDKFIEDFQSDVLDDWEEGNCDNACMRNAIAKFIKRYKINGQKLGISIYEAIFFEGDIIAWEKL